MPGGRSDCYDQLQLLRRSRQRAQPRRHCLLNWRVHIGLQRQDGFIPELTWRPLQVAGFLFHPRSCYPEHERNRVREGSRRQRERMV